MGAGLFPEKVVYILEGLLEHEAAALSMIQLRARNGARLIDYPTPDRRQFSYGRLNHWMTGNYTDHLEMRRQTSNITAAPALADPQRTPKNP